MIEDDCIYYHYNSLFLYQFDILTITGFEMAVVSETDIH